MKIIEFFRASVVNSLFKSIKVIENRWKIKYPLLVEFGSFIHFCQFSELERERERERENDGKKERERRKER